MMKMDINCMKKILRKMLVLAVAAVMIVSAAPVSRAFAANDDKPVREVHKVGVGGKQYCFFVQNNVVLTPAEVQKMTDRELTAEILKRTGLYMKETNCKAPSHKAITPDDWIKAGGSFLLLNADIEKMRSAEPAEGEPVKIYMDLKISTEPAEEDKPDSGGSGEGTDEEGEEEEPEKPSYSTYKKISPRLLFVAIATEADAASGEDFCEEEQTDNTDENGQSKTAKKKTKKKSQKEPSIPDDEGEAEEMLPEYRTIRMEDRSGGPVKATLEDGTPVTLEWIDPARQSDDGQSFLDHVPGGAVGLTIIAVFAAGAAAVLAAAVRRRREE